MTDFRRERQSYVRGLEETREAKAEKGGLCSKIVEESRRGGRLEEEDKRHRRVENTMR